MEITAADVSELRKRTGAGMMECKKALAEAQGNMDKAVEVLQKKGIAKAAERAGRIATEGVVATYVHGGRIGAMVELNCETDFVARTDEFKALARDVAMHVAASNPQYLDDTEIPADLVSKQREIFQAQDDTKGKPANIVEKILDGKVSKWKKEICLVDQPFVKDPDTTVGKFVVAASVQIKENVKIRRFVRFELGEGLEKKKAGDFAAEVAAAAKG